RQPESLPARPGGSGPRALITSVVSNFFYNKHPFLKPATPWTEEPGGLQSTGSRRVGHELESPEEKDVEENAALKIQAAFRGHLAREEVKKMKSSDLEEEKTEEND
ncbi:hypothetical protein FD754_009249, partial [Muntiacus muntjak]